MKLSCQVQNIPPSGIREFFELVLGKKDVISLGVGEPDFVTPWNIRESAIYAIEEGYTSYTSNKGMLELRQTVAHYLSRKYGLDYDPEDEVLITVGVSEGFDISTRALIEPGDEVLVPEPSFVAYSPLVTLCGGVPVPVTADPARGFKISGEDVERSSGEKTRAIVLNYPNNPTGASFSRDELSDIARAAERNDMIVISDETYCDLTYDGEHVAFPSLPGMRDGTVYLNGLSKSFAMTGWRLGFACGPREVIGAMTRIHQYTIMCAPIISQMAAIEALKRGERSVEEMKREYARRRLYIIDRLNGMGLSCHKPEGAFYAFPSIAGTGLSSMDFARELLKEKNVAVVPGTAFGASGEGYVRMSYASSFVNLKEAMDRLEEFIEERKS
jgi:aminotransferase